MYGFCLTFRSAEAKDDKNFEKVMAWKDYYVGYNPMPRFEDDKLFYQDNEKMVLLDGVVFNKKELLKETAGDSWKAAFDSIYHDDKITFMDRLRGSFCGIVIDKAEDRIIAFSNHTGERPTYYKLDGDNKCEAIASHVNFIEGYMKEHGGKLSANTGSAYHLLSIGACLGNDTPFKNIYRISAGKYVVIDKNRKTEENFYHVFSNVPEWDLSMDECIEKGDPIFRKAIERIYSKNEEYGYESECDLSGGLDSRMATYVAHEMGYHNILNMCYCIKNNLDNTISRKIARDLGNRYSFMEMNGNVFMDVDENTDLTGGQVFYGVGTGSRRSLNKIDTSNLGMCVTGLLGELENAYWTEGYEHTSPGDIDVHYSNFYPVKIDKKYSEPYINYEQMNIYELSFKLYISSSIVRQQTCEVTSPFLDVDYIDFIFRVPLKYRKDYNYISSWMIKCYPEAAEYNWQAKGMSVKDWKTKKKSIKSRAEKIMTMPARTANGIFRRAKIPFRFYLRSDMNPVDTWYYRNKEFREFINQYYDDNINAVEDSILREKMKMMFLKGQPIDKIMVINYLGINKRYFV